MVQSAPTHAAAVKSPNGKIEAHLTLAACGRVPQCPHLSVQASGRQILAPGILGLQLVGLPAFEGWFEVIDIQNQSVSDRWQSNLGERRDIIDAYNSSIVTLREQLINPRLLQIEVRAYDHAVAFRYVVPSQSHLSDLVIQRELTRFTPPPESAAWVARWAQAPYDRLPVNEMGDDVERPLTIEMPDGTFMALGEAGNLESTRMKFASHTAGGQPTGEIMTQWDSQVIAELPWSSPWRFAMYGESAGALIEGNDLLLNLSPPSQITDDTFIQPGKVIRETTLSTAGGIACVDFAVKRGLKYIEFDAGWYGHEYDEASDATSVSPDPDRTVRIPGWAGLDLPRVIQYARNHGIGVWLYVNRRSLERQLDAVLDQLCRWGVVGIKFGFVNVGPQGWTQWLHEAIQKCAQRKLMVDVHDEYRPNGITRTYPNMLTAEGIRGNEAFPTARHNVTLPFTRFVGGPADYTICVFSPRLKTRRTHQLAMAVVYFSPLQFMYWYDKPSDCNDAPELDFLDAVPTVWDETRVIAGEVGEFIAVARRCDDVWYLGCMTNENSRSLTIPLTFLTASDSYFGKIYKDPTKPKRLNDVVCKSGRYESHQQLKFEMRACGGFCAQLSPER